MKKKIILSFLGSLLLIPSLMYGDATTASRVRNFVSDKANSVPITASYMDAEFDNLITKANSKVVAKATAPSSPTTGDTWVDTSVTPPFVKVYDGTNWVSVGSTKGADVSSATTTTLGSDGNIFDITGTTTITSITAKPAGSIVRLQFDGALTLTDGSNLKLAGNFTTAAESTITLFSDGTNWYELSRSPSLASVTTAMLPTGTLVQMVRTSSSAVSTGTTQLPLDDTIPQNTEGDEYMSRAITPVSTTDRLIISSVVHLANNTTGANHLTCALFQDSTAGALAAASVTKGSHDDSIFEVSFSHEMAAGTTSSTTFKVRCGANSASTTTFNGEAGARLFGGVISSSITILEVKA